MNREFKDARQTTEGMCLVALHLGNVRYVRRWLMSEIFQVLCQALP
jgi:hypothetical protein